MHEQFQVRAGFSTPTISSTVKFGWANTIGVSGFDGANRVLACSSVLEKKG